jgi:hypothetical protein
VRKKLKCEKMGEMVSDQTANQTAKSKEGGKKPKKKIISSGTVELQS